VLNYEYGNLDHVDEMLRHPNVVPGLGDGGAHVGSICDGSFATTLLTHWGRDRRGGALHRLEDLIRLQANETAALFGLHDRGRIALGMRADINLIEFDKLGLRAPEVAHDLPAGGRRLLQRAVGYRATIVAGEVTYRDGEPTGALPGRLVRGRRETPAARAAA
jgi:N-acyl-D-aspartate/D-glutamate deacylase